MKNGFQRECVSKLNRDMFSAFSYVFESLTLGHLIDKRALVAHGVIFQDMEMTIDKFNEIPRLRQPPNSGPISDLLWSDPMDNEGSVPSPRGAFHLFGPDIASACL